MNEEYYIKGEELYDLLMGNDITYLYHANTLSTSITFLEEGKLLSRGFVEENGLFQSPQDTDKNDKILGIWNDLFLDTFDLTSQFKINCYGPITFVIKLDFIKDYNNILITKNNPCYWNKNCNYFKGIDEFRQTQYIKSADHMITINDAKIELKDYLEKIIYYNTGLKDSKNKDIDSIVIDQLSKFGFHIDPKDNIVTKKKYKDIYNGGVYRSINNRKLKFFFCNKEYIESIL